LEIVDIIFFDNEILSHRHRDLFLISLRGVTCISNTEVDISNGNLLRYIYERKINLTSILLGTYPLNKYYIGLFPLKWNLIRRLHISIDLLVGKRKEHFVGPIMPLCENVKSIEIRKGDCCYDCYGYGDMEWPDSDSDSENDNEALAKTVKILECFSSLEEVSLKCSSSVSDDTINTIGKMQHNLKKFVVDHAYSLHDSSLITVARSCVPLESFVLSKAGLLTDTSVLAIINVTSNLAHIHLTSDSIANINCSFVSNNVLLAIGTNCKLLSTLSFSTGDRSPCLDTGMLAVSENCKLLRWLKINVADVRDKGTIPPNAPFCFSDEGFAAAVAR